MIHQSKICSTPASLLCDFEPSTSFYKDPDLFITIMRTVFILCLTVSLLYLVSCCEEETHYKKDDKCCKKCGPGKRMLVDDNCEDPRCQDCQIGEYQSGYTTQTRCERQPSCDTNLHFQPQINPSTTSLSKCVCEHGYFCTQDDDCSTCMKQTVCKPGQRVAKKGSPTSDTVCETCKDGTFSIQDSADICEEWKKCDYGYDENTPGSSTSDRACLEAPGYRVGIIVGVVAVCLAIVILLVFIAIKKRNEGWMTFPNLNAKETVLNITKRQLEPDVERANQPLRQPEEDNETEPQSPTPSNMTENGNVVDQEQGKEHILSSTESNSYRYP